VLVGSAADRPNFQAELGARGIETLIHYPIAMPDQGASDPDWSAGESFAIARSICQRVVSLPVHPDLTDDEVQRVVAAVRAWAGAA
jgi:dTDP-4-amino-4,6-dideoxygalactose transaminase